MVRRRTREWERGAVFIHVAVALIVLLGMSAFVLDQGYMFVARAQLQSAADAGALAGAIGLAFDEPARPPDPSGPSAEAARTTTQTNPSVGAPAGVVVTFPDCPPGVQMYGNDCVRVEAHRDGTNGGSVLPAFFGGMFGATQQRARASAVAQAAKASASKCLKPWLIPDRWEEHQAPVGEFNPPGDIYIAPTSTADGTGWLPTDIGTALTLKAGNPAQAISPSDFYEIETATLYEEAITGCEIYKQIGDIADTLPGNRVGPTNSAVDDLLAANELAGRDTIVVVGLFSPAEFEMVKNPHGNFNLHITNMLAFKITGRSGNQIVGTIAGAPGELAPCTTTPCPTSTGLITVIRLVR